MRKKKSQPGAIAGFPAQTIKRTDTSGSRSESYHWGHLMDVLREMQHQFWHPDGKADEPTLAEITNTETRVRKELYP